MGKLQILHNPRCSKSRSALELLNNKGLKPDIIEYLKQPLTKDEIKTILHKLDLSPSQIVRKAEYSKLDVKQAETEDGLIQQMADHPILIERPIVINGDQARIGRPPESILDIL